MVRAASGIGIATLLASLLVGGCREEGDDAAPRLPALGVFNEHVLAVVASYPTDGTHGYHWPREGTWLGNARDLVYRGELFAARDPRGRCHCSGLTFEVFLQAWARWSRATGRPRLALPGVPGRDDLRRLQRQWFGTSGDRATLHTAITANALGVRIEDREEARPGDFVQLWRHSGSGHACIFRSWIRREGRIVGLTYWSTQKATRGIGERSERFGEEGAAVKRDELYVVRVGAPPERLER